MPANVARLTGSQPANGAKPSCAEVPRKFRSATSVEGGAGGSSFRKFRFFRFYNSCPCLHLRGETDAKGVAANPQRKLRKLRPPTPPKGFFARGAGGGAFGTTALATDHKMLW